MISRVFYFGMGSYWLNYWHFERLFWGFLVRGIFISIHKLIFKFFLFEKYYFIDQCNLLDAIIIFNTQTFFWNSTEFEKGIQYSGSKLMNLIQN